MGYYVFWKFYVPQAKNIYEAFDFLRQADEKGVLKYLFISQWAKKDEDDKPGWKAGFKKQIGILLRGK